VHGSKDRAKDASPESHATISRACVGCIRFVAHADDVPLLGDLLDIRCHRRVILQRGIPLPNDGPTETFVPTAPREGYCLPENQNAFHRYDTRRNRFAAKGLLPPAFVPALSLTPPTLCSQVGDSAFCWALQVSRCGHPRSGTFCIRECKRLLLLVGIATPGTDDPSMPPSSTDSTVDENRLSRSHRCQSQRLNGFYDRESVRHDSMLLAGPSSQVAVLFLLFKEVLTLLTDEV
jgi:hypothetical protein